MQCLSPDPAAPAISEDERLRRIIQEREDEKAVRRLIKLWRLSQRAFGLQCEFLSLLATDINNRRDEWGRGLAELVDIHVRQRLITTDRDFHRATYSGSDSFTNDRQEIQRKFIRYYIAYRDGRNWVHRLARIMEYDLPEKYGKYRQWLAADKEFLEAVVGLIGEIEFEDMAPEIGGAGFGRDDLSSIGGFRRPQ